MDVEVTVGNVLDSVAFPQLHRKILKRFPGIKKVVADDGYKIPYLAKLIIESGRIPVFPYKRQMGKEEFFIPYEYIFDEYYDCILCPENHVLSYSTTNRDGYREYKSKPYILPSILTPNDSGGMEYFKTERQKRGELGRKTSG